MVQGKKRMLMLAETTRIQAMAIVAPPLLVVNLSLCQINMANGSRFWCFLPRYVYRYFCLHSYSFGLEDGLVS
jgi:hypothetical protein